MFDAIKQKCDYYYSQLPNDIFPKVVRSALYSFSVCFISFNQNPPVLFNLGRPLIAAGIASLASLIYALTNPIFNIAFGDNRILLHREFIKSVVNIGISSLLINYVTASKVNIFSIVLIVSLSINLLLSVSETIPSTLAWLLNDPHDADELRNWFRWFGIYPEPGSSSVFLNFGNFVPN
jgi:hypothetical protein